MKKLINFIVVFTLIVVFLPLTVYAEKDEADFLFRNNEYLMLKEARNSKIFSIKSSVPSNYREMYIEHIISMQKYPDYELEKNFNYTNDQIYAIRNFDYSEDMIIRASSYVDVYGGFESYSHSSNYSTAKVVMAFNWYGSPAYYFKDIFAVTWTDFNVSSAKAVIGWSPTNPKYSYFSENVTVTASGTHSDYITFEKRIIPSHTLHGGSITYNFYAYHDVTDPVVYAAYGYNTINISPSVSFSSSGTSLGISFGDKMITADSARVYP